MTFSFIFNCIFTNFSLFNWIYSMCFKQD